VAKKNKNKKKKKTLEGGGQVALQCKAMRAALKCKEPWHRYSLYLLY
jgi:hypothetical protein